MHHLFKRISVIVASLVLAGAAGAGEDYRDAKESEPIFDHDQLGLMGIEMEKLAGEMGAYVSNRYSLGGHEKAGDDVAPLELASRILGIAIQLHPRNRTVLVANFKLARGLPTQPVKAEYEPEVLAEYLYTRSKILVEQGGEQNSLLAGYLLAISVEIDPGNEDAIYDLEIRELDGKPVNWELLYPPPDETREEAADTTE